MQHLVKKNLSSAGVSSPLDVVFALDGSSDVDIGTFKKVKEFAKGSLQAYDVSMNQTRVAVMVYGAQPISQMSLYDGIHKSVVRQKIDTTKRIGGDRNIIRALAFAEDKMFTDDTTLAPGKILILFLAGPSKVTTQATEIKSIAEKMKQRDIELFVVSLVGDKNLGGLETISKKENIISVPNPDRLKEAFMPVFVASGRAAGKNNR